MRKARVKCSRRGRVLFWLLAALAVLLLVAVVAFNGEIVDRTYRISSSKLTNEEPIRIVVIADLHSHAYGGDQKPLIDRVKKMEPDIICLVGDLGDDHEPFDGAALLLDGIIDLAPCYYVSGNHECWGDYPPIKEALLEYGVTILEGDSRTITVKGQTLNLCGIEDPCFTPHASYDELLWPFEQLPEDAYNILLSHRPEFIETISQYGFDLVLSGHTHGGQLRIPLLLDALYAPNQGFLPKYSGGLYQVEETTLVISRGLSYNPRMPRVFNPPELVLVELSK